ncbi:MAG: CotH kinase family protein [Verrucomicrobiota bacterium]|nr:CotH kinase family protein [Verrucomicrobiota bacterium]
MHASITKPITIALLALCLASARAGAALVINEIHYHPYGASGTGEFVEILNHSDSPVNLSGYRVSGGIDFTFPSGLYLAPHQSIVVVDDPSRFTHLQLDPPPQGPFQGRLSNSSDRLRLRNASGTILDEVVYADRGFWPIASDGHGPSLELIHPNLPNHFASAWAPAFQSGGSPGSPNSTYKPSPPPAVGDVLHSPTFPTADQPILVLAQIQGISPLLPQPVLLARDPYKTDDWAEFSMFDDGAHADLQPNDYVYGASIPAGFSSSPLLEFKLRTTGSTGAQSLFPATNERFTCLIPIGPEPPASQLPTYTLLLSPTNRTWLETRDVFSDDPVHATFIGPDGTVFYEAVTRYRGSTSRTSPKKSFRVDFPGDHPFQGFEKLNLMARFPIQQWASYDLSRRAGLPTPHTQLVYFNLNQDPAQLYLQVEAVDTPMLERAFGSDAGDGNLYRAEKNGDLSDYGEDPLAYKPRYSKVNNTEADDWSDLIRLSQTFGISETDRFQQEIEQRLDIDQLSTFIAVRMVLNDLEGGIWRSSGDDYFLFFPPGHQPAILIPWDFDSTFREADDTIWRTEVPSIRRILRSNHFGPRFVSAIDRILHDQFSEAVLRARFATLPAEAASEGFKEELLALAAERRTNVACEISRELTWQPAPHPRWNVVTNENLPWRFCRGFQEPADGMRDWTLPEFDDSSWELGHAPFGTGAQVATPLPDMPGNYVSLYVRIPFQREALEAACGSGGGLVWRTFFRDGCILFLNGREFGRLNMGSDGSFVPFDQRALGAHAIDKQEDFVLRPVRHLLQDGTNILAVQCHKQWLTAPTFLLDGTLWAIGFDKASPNTPILHTGPETALQLFGRLDQTLTGQVTLSGWPVLHNIHYGTWQATADLLPGWNNLTLRAFDLAGIEVGPSVAGQIYHQQPPPAPWTGTLEADTTVGPEQGAILIQDKLVIPAGLTLSIQPGSTLFFEGTASIEVQGVFNGIGTRQSPILIAPSDYAESTASLTLQINEDTASLHLEHVQAWNLTVSATTGPETATALLRNCRLAKFAPGPILHAGNQSSLTVEQSSFTQAAGDTAINLVEQAQANLLNSLIHNSGIALMLHDEASASLDHVTIADCPQGGIILPNPTPTGTSPRVTVQSSILWNCTPTLQPDNSELFLVEYSNLQRPEPPPFPGTQNLNSNPQFQVDYRLRFTSPCIGTGRDRSDQGYAPFTTTPNRWEAY